MQFRTLAILLYIFSIQNKVELLSNPKNNPHHPSSGCPSYNSQAKLINNPVLLAAMIFHLTAKLSLSNTSISRTAANSSIDSLTTTTADSQNGRAAAEWRRAVCSQGVFAVALVSLCEIFYLSLHRWQLGERASDKEWTDQSEFSPMCALAVFILVSDVHSHVWISIVTIWSICIM